MESIDPRTLQTSEIRQILAEAEDRGLAIETRIRLEDELRKRRRRTTTNRAA